MKRLLLLICTLLCANVLFAQTRFWIGDLQYEVTSTNPTKVKVYKASESITIANIPETVTYNETTYSVTSIEEKAFQFCDNLTSVTIPNSVTSIGKWAFFSCSSLTSVTIPNSVTSSLYGTFCYCDNLTSVVIGNSVTSIGEDAFAYCHSLTSVTIPNSVTSIGNNAFDGCSSLTSVTIDNGVTSIGNYAFSDCSSLSSVAIGNSVASIGDWVFEDCSSLTSIDIPNSVTSIGERAFIGCSGLASVTIPNSVTSIGKGAFEDCSSLTSAIIGNGVTSIGNYAFVGCSSLQNVTCLATTPPTLAGNTVFPNPNTATLTVPCGTLEVYNSSDWNIFFADRIEEDCGGIEQAEAESISFFPNPTKSEITFSQTIEKVEVIDLIGKAILTFTNVKTINVEPLPAGAYYLRLTNNDKAIIQKVIKE